MLADRVIDNGRVRIEDGYIAAVEEAPAPASSEPAARWITPGFVDLHVHGGGGHSMTSGDPDEALAAARFHQSHGTTSTLFSLVTAPLDEMCRCLGALAPVVDGRQVVGLHLEGPFLSTAKCGALDPASMLAPDAGVLEQLLRAGSGTVRTMTFAPELPGALELIGHLRAAGVVASVGHTDATHAEVAAAVALGATGATHLGNAMRSFHHRAPGPLAALLGAPGVVCEAICDGVHLHPATVALFARAAGERGLALVTDAVAAAGLPGGAHRLGSREIEIRDGVAVVAGTDTLAGSLLTMDEALRRAVVECGLSPVQACLAAASVPAAVLGIDDRTGAIRPGLMADLCIFDAAWRLEEVIARGETVAPA